MNEARLRMTRIPKGADLILNKVSGAPGCWIGNVIVMAADVADRFARF
jgi:molybdopterin-biosynthesis enzyme MoeA-like protein